MVLIVDDDPVTRGWLADCVQGMGLSVRQADNGASVLAYARSLQPDLVLLDARLLPNGGADVLAQLKADPSTRPIPVIVLGPTADPPTAIECLERGAEDYLAKPLETTLLRRRIGAALGRQRAQAGHRTGPEARPLRGVMAAAMERAAPAAAENLAILVPFCEADTWVWGDQRLLVEALAGLLECAARFRGPGREVQIGCARVGDHVHLRIRGHETTAFQVSLRVATRRPPSDAGPES